MYRAILAGLILVSLTPAARAVTLYSTGFAAGSRVTQVAAGGNDGNWTLESDPGANSPFSPFVTDGSSAPSFPFGSPGWTSDTASSQWVSPEASETSSDPNSLAVPYVYQQTFSLVGVVPSSLVITGQWSADNFGFIEINGHQVVVGTDGNITNVGGQFESFTTFVLNNANIGSFLTAGSNTIQFDVFNTANGTPDVTGVNVDIESVTSTESSAPEPATFGFIGLGLAAIGFARKAAKR
jgi:hypothetical protein